jgi:hypothetical protein
VTARLEGLGLDIVANSQEEFGPDQGGDHQVAQRNPGGQH